MTAKTGAAAAIAVSASDNLRPEVRHWPAKTGASVAPIGVIRLEVRNRRAAEAGCQRLLRAQLKAGAHWLRDPRDFAAACASVGLVA